MYRSLLLYIAASFFRYKNDNFKFYQHVSAETAAFFSANIYRRCKLNMNNWYMLISMYTKFSKLNQVLYLVVFFSSTGTKMPRKLIYFQRNRNKNNAYLCNKFCFSKHTKLAQAQWLIFSFVMETLEIFRLSLGETLFLVGQISFTLFFHFDFFPNNPTFCAATQDITRNQ